MNIHNIDQSIDAINQAIDAILHGGQEYTIGNRTIKKAELSKLFEEKRKLEKMRQSAHGVNLYYVY